MKEFIGGIIDKTGKGKKLPNIHLKSFGDFWKFIVDIDRKPEEFYIKKSALKKYELQAIYAETFNNYKFNGHCYIRPEMEVKYGDVVVDAGACEGYYARYALNRGASRVILFEPCPELACGLKKTFEKEIDMGKVCVIEKALGRKRCNHILFVNKNMFCSSSIAVGSNNDIKKYISIISLDEVMESMNIQNINILKMDIEGAEVNAIIGAKKIIKKSHPRIIVATYHSFFNAIRIKNICINLDHEYKYKVFGAYLFDVPYRPYMTFLY